MSKEELFYDFESQKQTLDVVARIVNSQSGLVIVATGKGCEEKVGQIIVTNFDADRMVELFEDILVKSPTMRIAVQHAIWKIEARDNDE